MKLSWMDVQLPFVPLLLMLLKTRKDAMEIPTAEIPTVEIPTSHSMMKRRSRK